MNSFIILKLDNDSNELEKIIINDESFDFVKEVIKEYLSSINDTFNDEDIIIDSSNKLIYIYPENTDMFYFKILES